MDPQPGWPDADPADPSLHGICANRSGACVQARAAWGMVISKYDALLAANLNPAGPDDRRIVFSRARLWLRRGTEVCEAGAAAVTDFQALSHRELEWRFALMDARWVVRLTLGDGNEITLRWHSWDAPAGDWEFIMRPDLENRSFHTITQAYTGPEEQFPRAISVTGPRAFHFDIGGPWRLEMTSLAEFKHAPEWTYMVPLPFSAARGLQGHTDVFSPGSFHWKAGDMELRAAVSSTVARASSPKAPQTTEVFGREAQATVEDTLRAALDLFLTERDGGLTVIAGFPWFLDWGRDSLIFVRGLAAAGRVDAALAIVRRFAEFERGGSIPNVIRGHDASNRETSDAPLWLIIALRDIAAMRTGVLLVKAGARTLTKVVCDIVRAHIAGTEHGVRFDKVSGLLWSPSHFTWMDTARPAGTPREGYPIEIQALWAAALEFAHQFDVSAGYAALAEQVRASAARLYWREADGFLSDCLHAPAGVPAASATADDHLRPNQLFTITLGLLRDPDKCRRILASCHCLLVPGALRSLADRPVKYPLPVEWNGAPLHDPHHPYHGSYTGPEDTHRKPAYHNGTAWTWLFPTYCEALALVHPGQYEQARTLMHTTAQIMRGGCRGQIAEIVDGDPPHALRGCGAQAWSASEWLRVWVWLEIPCENRLRPLHPGAVDVPASSPSPAGLSFVASPRAGEVGIIPALGLCRPLIPRFPHYQINPMAKASTKTDSPAPKKAAAAVKRRKVALAVRAPQALKAAVAGTFNDWQPQPLKAADEGLFSLTLLLPPGDYEYRFVVDGEWRSDSACPDAVPNPFGESNSLLRVA